MLELLVGSTLVGGLVVYWYGYMTLDRIQKWGDKLNHLGAMFQSVASAEEMAGHSVKIPGRIRRARFRSDRLGCNPAVLQGHSAGRT